MINKISSIRELQIEKARLIVRKATLQDDIKKDFQEFKDSLKPANWLHNKLNLSNNHQTGIMDKVVGTSAGLGLEFLLTRVFMRNSSFIKKTLVALLIHNVGLKFFINNSDVIVAGIKNVIGKIQSAAKNEGVYDQSTVSERY